MSDDTRRLRGGSRRLRFGVSGQADVERDCRTPKMSPDLSEQASRLALIVVRWARALKRCERQGIAVDQVLHRSRAGSEEPST